MPYSENYIEIVQRLNDYHFSKLNDKDDTITYFSYSTCGHIHIISYGDKILWNSDNETREWIEFNGQGEYEDLENYVKEQFNEYVDKLRSLKFWPERELRKEKLKRILKNE